MNNTSPFSHLKPTRQSSLLFSHATTTLKSQVLQLRTTQEPFIAFFKNSVEQSQKADRQDIKVSSRKKYIAANQH